MKRELAYYGSSWLRKKARRIEEINDEVKQLIEDLLDTMREHESIGLAATQIKEDLAVFVTKVPIPQEDGEWKEGEEKVYINPKILSYSKETICYNEGCMSIPKLYIPVERPRTVIIEAMNRQGEIFQAELHDLFSANFCHENDHLNGVLTVDRTDKKTKEKIKDELRNIKKKYS